MPTQNKKHTPPEMVTTQEVAMMVDVALRTVRYREAKGKMPPRTEGYRGLYNKEEVKGVLRYYFVTKAYVAPMNKALAYGRKMEALDA